MPATTRRRLFAAPALLPGLARAQGPAAEAFPSRPLTWVVPFAPGGITDTSSRVVAQRLGQILGQSVVVENRPGAGGTIGAEAVARAPADGHTLLYGSQGPMAAASALYPALRYDPLRDFAPVQALGASPNLIICAPGKPWDSLAAMVAAARARPEGLTYGSTGIGTAPHLAAELLQQVAGIRLVHAPYANGAQAMNDAIGGRLDVFWDYPLTSIPHLRDGRLRALAVTDHQRVALAPEVPTVAEAGMPGAEMVAWAGIFVPVRTPAPVVARLEAAMRLALADARVREFFDGTATLLWPEMGAVQFEAFLRAEVPRIGGLIARAGARPG
jgi:tripartite-type tricarboxylate transporter receptor subunit TctC